MPRKKIIPKKTAKKRQSQAVSTDWTVAQKANMLRYWKAYVVKKEAQRIMQRSKPKGFELWPASKVIRWLNEAKRLYNSSKRKK